MMSHRGMVRNAAVRCGDSINIVEGKIGQINFTFFKVELSDQIHLFEILLFQE